MHRSASVAGCRVFEAPAGVHFGRMGIMKRILVVVDMQNDFIDGALGTAEAAGIVDNVVRKIHSYPPDCIYATRDTHGENYLETPEGKYLPV